jgi:glycosyltransferase involved in cell wall biosynthesis
MINKISCVIHTYNSEKYLKECLSSIQWCDEIVIVDMYSTDKTLAIAEEFDAKIYMHENVGYADPARAFGLSKCSNDWIIALDSDELIPTKLKVRFLELMEENQFDVFKISFRNFFFGKEIIGSGWGYKDQVIARFFKKEYLKYGTEVHNFIQISDNARIGSIIGRDISIIHFNYDSVNQFIRKLNTYTDNEVNSTKYNYKGSPAFKIIYHFFREILGRFIYKKGYKDGWIGFYLAFSMAFYRASAIAKSNLENESKIISKYKKMEI